MSSWRPTMITSMPPSSIAMRPLVKNRWKQLRACRFLIPSSGEPRRFLSTSQLSALDAWIQSPKHLTTTDTLSPEHLHKLYVTLPTRTLNHSSSTRVPLQPKIGEPLGYGHHLTFFLPKNPEADLRSDGTDVDFCPPEPFTRRMWAGGKFTWSTSKSAELKIGDTARADSRILEIQKKGFEGKDPMVFVKQRVSFMKGGESGKNDEVAIEEERTHVYLAGLGSTRTIKEVTGLPKADFSFTYLPTPTTLFRFSALTFNGHYIHLSKEYAQSEGYSERLVHGPLTALMMLESFVFCRPDVQGKLRSFEYRARNPLVVNQTITLYGAWENDKSVQVWAKDENGTVGMTGRIAL